MNTKRIVYLDMLKVISCIAVVLIHATAIGFTEINIQNTSWKVSAIFNLIPRFAVPVFVMVSGALFLNKDKEISIKKLYTKNILHLVIIYIVWTFIYSAYNVYNNAQGFSLLQVLKGGIIKSYYHLWFIPMLIGVYICVPFLKSIVKDKKIVEYFLLIFLLFNVIPTTIKLFKFPYSGYIGNILSRIQVPSLSYLGYFILGHYLHTYDMTKKKRRTIYILGIVSLIVAIVGTIFYSLHLGYAKESFCREFSITTYLMSIAIFVLMKSLLYNKEVKFEKVIIHFSEISLGIYLTHALFRDILKNQWEFSFTNMWMLPVNMIVTIALSYILTVVLKKIPVINKYIV